MARNSSGCRSCLIWLACIFVFLALVVGVGAYIGYRKAQAFLNQYAQTKPLALPVVSYTPAEVTNLNRRIDQFMANAQSGRTNARLALTAQDLNVLLSSTGFSNRLHITLRSNTVAGQFSVPLEELGMPLFRGRYFNGTGTLDVGCANGTLKVTIKDLGMNGQNLPEHYMTYIRRQNFAQGVGTNSVTRESLEHIGRVAIEKEQLIFEVTRGLPPK
jgi:hypothetical protein